MYYIYSVDSLYYRYAYIIYTHVLHIIVWTHCTVGIIILAGIPRRHHVIYLKFVREPESQPLCMRIVKAKTDGPLFNPKLHTIIYSTYLCT